MSDSRRTLVEPGVVEQSACQCDVTCQAYSIDTGGLLSSNRIVIFNFWYGYRIRRVLVVSYEDVAKGCTIRTVF